MNSLLYFAFANHDFNKIKATIDTRNERSFALAERPGMKREGEFKEDEFFKGEWTDTYVYGILRSEWKVSGLSTLGE